MNQPPSYEEAVNNIEYKSNKNYDKFYHFLTILTGTIFLSYFFYYVYYNEDICYFRYIAENKKNSVILPSNSVMCQLSNPSNLLFIVIRIFEIFFQILTMANSDMNRYMNNNLNYNMYQY
jgi:hypothetical protein